MLWRAILPLAGLLDEVGASGLGALLAELPALGALGRWPAPELAVHWVVALHLLPPFALVVAADLFASDLDRGTLRLHALRAPRAAIYLGRFLGQVLIQLALVVVTLASVLAVIALARGRAPLDEALAVAPAITLALAVQVLPWLALMALCSALARSPRRATLYAMLAWVVVALLAAALRERLGPLAVLDVLLPGSEISALRGAPPEALLEHLVVPLAQTLVLVGLGLALFARRDL